MTEQDLKDWLVGFELNAEQKLLAGIALALAQSFDNNASTATAAELRKTILELQRQINAGLGDHDPLEKLLTR